MHLNICSRGNKHMAKNIGRIWVDHSLVSTDWRCMIPLLDFNSKLSPLSVLS